MSSYLDVIAAYESQADMLAERYEAVSSERMLAEVMPVIPDGSDSKLALDVGAGTGRDAAWLTSIGYEVVATEPAAGMRRIAAEKHWTCPGKVESSPEVKGELDDEAATVHEGI